MIARHRSSCIRALGVALRIGAFCVVAPVALAQGRPIPGPPTGQPPTLPPGDPPTIGVPGRLPPVIGTSSWGNANRQSGCRQANEARVTADCVMVSSGMLEAALTTFDADREFYDLILVPAQSKVVVIVFDQADQPPDRKLRIARDVYDAEVGAFERLVRGVRRAIATDTAYAARVMGEFKLDDARVAELRHVIVSERQSRIDQATSLLTGNPSTRGLQFECSTACRDLNNAAKYLTQFP